MRTLPLFKLFAPALAALLVASACGGQAEPTAAPAATQAPGAFTPVPSAATATPEPAKTAAPPTPSGEQPRYGGSVTVPVAGNWAFDPAGNVFGFSWDKLGAGGNIWSQAIRTSPTDRKTLEGDLAESWELSGDGLTLKLNVRKGVIDHEGSPYTAEDLYYQFYRFLVQPNKTPANTQSCLRGYLNPILDKTGAKMAEPGVELVGTDVLLLRFNASRAANLACVASPSVLFVPGKYIKQIDADPKGYRDIDPSKGELIGTGPFKLDAASYQVNSTMGWAKNTTYFRKGMPYLDKINVVFMADSSAILANIRAGRVDTLSPLTSSFTVPEVKQLETDLKGAIVVKYMEQYRWDGFELNTRRPPFGPVGDPAADKVRTAIQLGFNRWEHIQVIYDGLAFPTFGYNQQDTWINSLDNWYKNFPAYSPDPAVRTRLKAQANQLLSEAGYSEANRLKFTIICSAAGIVRCEQVAGQLNNDLLVAATVETVDSQTNTKRITTGDFQVMTTNHNGRFNDPDAMNLNMYPLWEKGGRNYTGYENPEWIKLNAQQVVEMDKAKRGALLNQMALLLYKDAGLINAANGKNMWLMRSNWRGFTTMEDPNTNYTLETVWLAK